MHRLTAEALAGGVDCSTAAMMQALSLLMCFTGLHLLCCVVCVGYLPSFWIKLRNLDVAGPHLQLPWVSTEVGMQRTYIHPVGALVETKCVYGRQLQRMFCWRPAQLHVCELCTQRGLVVAWWRPVQQVTMLPAEPVSCVWCRHWPASASSCQT